MGSDLECAVCYRTFNAARRCPRELRCRHSFCESCLLALSRGAGPEGPEEGPEEAPRTITCPLCRSTTSISGGSQVRAELRVDEAVLERLMSAGVLDREEEEEEEEEEKQRRLPDTPAEESAPFPGTRGGRLRRSWRKVWRKISGDRQDSATNEDIHALAMMSCLMF